MKTSMENPFKIIVSNMSILNSRDDFELIYAPLIMRTANCREDHCSRPYTELPYIGYKWSFR